MSKNYPYIGPTIDVIGFFDVIESLFCIIVDISKIVDYFFIFI